MRVSGSALDRVVAEVEIFVRALGQSAGECAARDQRKTIQDTDIASALASLRKA